MNRVRVSAPGKVILMGEHAVVYGMPALLAAIDKRLTVTVSKAPTYSVSVSEGKEYIDHIVDVVVSAYALPARPNVHISIESELPIGYHLGSSAAVAVSLVGALSYYTKKIWNPVRINQLSYEAEKFIHGNPSGADPAVIVSGGIIWYRKELEFLRSIWQLPVRVSSDLSNFFLIQTSRPKESTGEMVAFVAKQHGKNPERMEQLFRENERQTKQIAKALKEQSEEELLLAMRKGERSLEEMGVVSEQVVPCIRSIEETGGAAKVLGGGGKTEGVGFLLCYHKHQSVVSDVAQANGYTCIPITIGEDGVKLEEADG